MKALLIKKQCNFIGCFNAVRMNRKGILLILGLCPFFGLTAQVVINEFSAANYSADADNYGEFEDWIELYNAGATAVDIGGYFLSDNPGNPDKWEIPAGTSISAGGFLRFWCSGRDVVVGTNYHTSFKITQTVVDEAVLLTDPDGTTILDIHEIDEPNQTNHSWGRSPNGTDNWRVFTDPTPNASNTTTNYGFYATKPDMSPNAGNYAGSVSVTITSPQPDVTIRYTTNGSAPTASSTIYSGAINITETTVLRAAAYHDDTDTLASWISTNTYFIDETTTVPVISIAGQEVDDLLNGNSWLQPVGSFELFDENFVLIDEAIGEFNEHGNDSWAYDQRGFDWIVRDQFGYDNDIDHEFFADVTDRTGYQRMIAKAAANDNYPASSGGAHVRDAYVHHLSQLGGLELDERSTFFHTLFLNGDYWGVYDTREKVDDDDYTDYYYGQDEFEMDFIKCWGGTWAEYGTLADWDPFVNFITTNDMTDPANYTYVTDNLNVLSLIDYMQINTVSVCKDWLNWNTAWWRGYDPDGGALTWRYILWDNDATFGHYINYTGIPDDSPTADPCDPLTLGSTDPNGHVDMVNALLDNTDFFSLYVNRYADMNATVYSCDYMLSVLDSMKNVIDPEMERHTDKWGGSYSGWQSNYDELYEFIEERCAYMAEGIEDCFDTPAYPITVEIDPAGSTNQVKVNTIIPTIYPFNATYYGGVTFSLEALPASGYVFDHWEFLHNTPSSDVDPAITASLESSDTIIAYFVEDVLPTYNFTLDVYPPDAGIAYINDVEVASYPYTTIYPNGQVVEMDAEENEGYIFDYWELENHLVNPDPFLYSVYFIQTTEENVMVHFKSLTDINEQVAGLTAFNVVPSLTQGDIQVQFDMSEPGDVSIDLFSVTGSMLANISNGYQPAGEQILPVNLDNYNLSPGIYFVRIQSNGISYNQQIVYTN
jgi:hypothetical protein